MECSNYCEVPELLSEELSRKTKWRLFQVIFEFVKKFNEMFPGSVTNVVGRFIRESIRQVMPNNICFNVCAKLERNTIEKVIETFKGNVEINLLNTDIFFSACVFHLKFKMKEIEIQLEFKNYLSIDYSVNLLTSSNWNYLINFCEMKISDPYFEFDPSSFDQSIVELIKESKYRLDINDSNLGFLKFFIPILENIRVMEEEGFTRVEEISKQSL